MVQARLPDINTEFITYRREALSCISGKNYSGLFTALYAYNALLPEKYQIKISTKDYNKITKEDIYVECENCTEIDPEDESDEPKERQKRILYKDLIIKERLLPSFEASIKGKDSYKFWKCPKCKKETILEKTNFKQKVRKKPYYLRVMPEPPARKDGIMDKKSYHRKIAQWAGNFLAELAHQESKFREDYVPKDNELETEEIQLSSEEQET